ncbi:MAG TPA: tungstate ABC transporter substrate-binding protein WtpA [Candidatus Methanofastidiosa archaeon]|nr:tungstate ABC transporter substrate-binding protein WtpA [Candidatus Methanofastidiosa archaeon]HPR41345.1 tungstate ABC transporter substrate-binding protein WtpA [Candidatus Methanofastidiosa archaeon]
MKLVLMAAMCLVITISMFSGCISSDDEEEHEAVTLKVLHAGSLASPFEKIEAEFEAEYPYIDVQLEAAGSVSCVNKIIETGVEADVLASADYTLIPSMMMPDYADWYVLFASNEMVLTYSDNSNYADEITADNWYDILRRDDVLWAFSNPNLDPCGYRTPMVIQLAELEYGDDMIFDDLIVANSAISVEESSGVYTITAPEALDPDTDYLTIRDKSVDLVAMIQEGGLDYAWEYLSVAVQNDLNYIRLPSSINLSSVSYADTYDNVSIILSNGGTQTGKPIVYGITIPLNAPNAEEAALFVEYVINGIGQGIFTEDGQPPIVPAGVNDIDLVPGGLEEYLEEI